MSHRRLVRSLYPTQHAQQALTDYIDVINSEADKRTAQDDPLLAAVEKLKNKKRGKQHV